MALVLAAFVVWLAANGRLGKYAALVNPSAFNTSDTK